MRARRAHCRQVILPTLAGLVLVAIASSPVASGQTVAMIDTVAGGGPHDVPAVSVNIVPSHIAVDAAGNVYFPVMYRHRIYKVETGGLLRVVAGTGIEQSIGDGGLIGRASFLLPETITLDPSGNVLVHEGAEVGYCCSPDFPYYNRESFALRRLNLGTGVVDHLAGKGSGVTGLWFPVDLAVGAAGEIFVAEKFRYSDGSTVGLVEGLDPATGLLRHVAGNGDWGGPLNDGSPATDVSLWFIRGIAIQDSDPLFIGDDEHDRIRTVDLATGIIDSYPPTVSLGSGDLAFDAAGNLYVGRGGSVHRVDAVTGSIDVVAGTGTVGYSGDGGPALSAEIYPRGIALDAAGDLFIRQISPTVIRRVDAVTGIIDTIAGDPAADPYGDGGPATQARVRYAVDVAVASSGDIFIAEAGQTTVLRRIEAASGEIETLVRTGCQSQTNQLCPRALSAIALYGDEPYYATFTTHSPEIGPINKCAVFRYDIAAGQAVRVVGDGIISGYSGDGGPAEDARLNGPRDIAFDGAGNLFIADTRNGVIRRVDGSTWIITTYAGGGSGLGDGGPATLAELQYPTGVALDGAGNLYIADQWDHRVRLVDAGTGDIFTVAGTGSPGFSGDGGPATAAELRYPRRVELDGAGNLYISGDERIRRVDAVTGWISTLAGDGTLGLYGDGGPAAIAALGGANGMAFNGDGDLLVAADDAGRIRRITVPEYPVPPSAIVSVTPSSLWPANHRMVEIHASVDPGGGPGPFEIELVSITSNEADDAPGTGSTANDIQDADFGTADFDFRLRAERDGAGEGRVYTIVYQVTNPASLSATGTAFVTVPHDRGGVVDPIVLSVDETPSGTVISWPEVPEAHSYNVIRGDLHAIEEAVEVIDLGDVICIEARSIDTTTAGDEDTVLPAPGEGFFYLGEYLDPAHVSYGSPHAAKPRLPASGACP